MIMLVLGFLASFIAIWKKFEIWTSIMVQSDYDQKHSLYIYFLLFDDYFASISNGMK